MRLLSLPVCHRSHIAESVSHHRNSLFGHVARLQQDIPAHKVNYYVELSLGRPPSSQWNCYPGRPCNRWVDQIRLDKKLPPADLWRCAVNCGHREMRHHGIYWLSVNDDEDKYWWLMFAGIQ